MEFPTRTESVNHRVSYVPPLRRHSNPTPSSSPRWFILRNEANRFPDIQHFLTQCLDVQYKNNYRRTGPLHFNKDEYLINQHKL